MSELPALSLSRPSSRHISCPGLLSTDISWYRLLYCLTCLVLKAFFLNCTRTHIYRAPHTHTVARTHVLASNTVYVTRGQPETSFAPTQPTPIASSVTPNSHLLDYPPYTHTSRPHTHTPPDLLPSLHPPPFLYHC